MAATDHTRLRTARVAARKNSDGNHGDAARYRRAILLNSDSGVPPKIVERASRLIGGES
jgi:hypothetical protein